MATVKKVDAEEFLAMRKRSRPGKYAELFRTLVKLKPGEGLLVEPADGVAANLFRSRLVVALASHPDTDNSRFATSVVDDQVLVFRRTEEDLLIAKELKKKRGF